MHTTPDNEVPDSRTHSFSVEALSVQLSLLQTFLPMDCWIVGRYDGHGLEVIATVGIATVGNIDASAAQTLACFLGNEWQAHGRLGSLGYRPVTDAEREHIGSTLFCERLPRHATRADLARPDGQECGTLLGLSQQQLPDLYSAIHSREISLCLSAIAHILNLQVELALAEHLASQAHQEALTDALTGVLNRTGWNLCLQQAADMGNDIVIGFLDLNCLKCINDAQGHLAGDELLKLTAQTIASILRSSDCVARLGGDEFAVLLTNATAAESGELKERLESALGEFNIDVAVGVALRSEVDSVEQTMELADRRMYHDKRRKQNANRRLRKKQVDASGRPVFAKPLL